MKTLNKFLCTSLIILTCITSIPLQGLVGAGIDYVGLFTVNAAAANDSGTCGKNAKWKYDRNTKTLTVYGTGAMDDYDPYNGVESPYYDRETYPIKNVVVSSGITRIGEDAFSYLFEDSDVETVKIADSVTSIGVGAFSGAQIKTLTLPKKLKKIERGAFASCKNLKKVVIPDSVTVIERYAFDYCNSLQEIVFGNGVKEIFDVYGGCSKLTKVTFGKNVKSFKFDFMNYGNDSAPIFVHKDNKYFSSDDNGVLFNKKKTKLILYPGKIKLTSYTVPKTVTAIADEAFYDVSKLQTVNTSNVKKIGDSAFAYSDITEVVLGKKVETIGDGAFQGCENLETVRVPAGVIKIGSDAFSEESKVEIDKNNKKYLSEDGVLFNKSKTTLIKYSKNDTADTYTIPETVTKISDKAFFDNDNLVNVIFPEGLRTIGDEAFFDCDGLKKVTLPKNISTIGIDAFGSCDNLKKVTVAEGSTAVIKSGAFSFCGQLNSISISSKIYKIGDDAFDCTKYTNSLEDKKYVGAYYIGSVLCGVIGEPVTIKIKEGTLGVADRAILFNNVKTVTIPASLKYIGENAFEKTDNLTKITVSKNNKYFLMEKGALLNKGKTRIIKYATKSSAKEYKAPDTVRYVDNYAFCSGTKLENIDISSKVNKINITMFMGTKMYDNFPKDDVVYYKKHAIDYIPDRNYTGLIILKAGTKSVSINEYSDNCIDAMYVPKSVTYMGDLPEEIYYEGSEEDWAKMKFGENIHYYYDNINIHYNYKNDSKHIHDYYKNFIYPEKCFSNIMVEYICPCGYSYTKKGPVFEHHIYSEKQYIEKPATTKSSGVKYEVCASCKVKYEKITIARIDSVKLSYTNTKYNGKVKTPTVTITNTNGYTLCEDYDYTLKYSSGRKEVGTYYVTVTFKGDYSGTKQLKFNIVPA